VSILDLGLNRGSCGGAGRGTPSALLKSMTPDDLKARTKKFAVDVIRFAKAIPKDHIND
jgi:hypothetical protein